MTTSSDDVLRRIFWAQATGCPIELARGPGFDNRLNSQLGKLAHKSEVCRLLKELIGSKTVREEDTGKTVVAAFGHEQREYPVVRLLVAGLPA